MKILLISNMYPSPDNINYGVFVKNFADQMTACGFDIQLTVVNGRGKTFFQKICKYLVFSYKTITLLRKLDFDIIYVHYINHSLIPLIFFTIPKNKYLVINAHGGDIFTENRFSKLIQKIVFSVIKSADLVVVPSPYFSHVVSEKFSIDTCKIFVSPSSGVDRRLFKASQLTSKSTAFTIGYVSRIDEGKGWNILLLAIDRLRKFDMKKFQVLIAGGGTQVKQLRAMLNDLDLNEYVRYVGPVEHRELSTYYHQMDVFVFPTTRWAESLGLVGLEALSCGVPVVGSAIGGLPSYIKPGYNGKLFPPGNSAQLAKCLLEMMVLDTSELNAYKRNAVYSVIEYDSLEVRQAMKKKLLLLVDQAR